MNILILSNGGESTDKIKNEAESRGHDVTLVDPIHCDLTISNNAKGYDAIHHLGKRIYYKDTDVVISRSGSGADMGLHVLRQFENMGIPVTNTSDSTRIASNKFTCGQILSAAKIQQPKTVYSKKPDNVKQIINSLGGLPVIIKLLKGSQGNGISIVKDIETANTTLESFYHIGADLVLQQYLENSKDLRLWVIDGEYICSMERLRKKNDFRANASRGAEAIKVTPTKAEKEMAIQAANACGLGIAGVDILRHGIESYCLEVNSSPGLKKISEVNPEINLPGKIVDYAEKIGKNAPKKDKNSLSGETQSNSTYDPSDDYEHNKEVDAISWLFGK